MANNFVPKNKYKRNDVLDLLGIEKDSNGKRGGVYATGYFKFENAYYVFVNIGIEGRTGHDYDNKFLSETELYWFAKSNAKINQAQIQELLNHKTQIHLFYREDNRVEFIYFGRVKAASYQDTKPVQITWKLVD
ncbi:DUF3427 domain-containing protein [Moraxella nasibovis]|uniref:DUF3427 domain-containing protein n=1 Tax=Moraxella nasibovis TaxID=2904120 RepID=UPI0024102073|nr:DUF3427 domain-containing protein [Moraxella nasibovis]WFF39025.1 DUF3427 domain-containing protein [Moraxella nasibovis]